MPLITVVNGVATATAEVTCPASQGGVTLGVFTYIKEGGGLHFATIQSTLVCNGTGLPQLLSVSARSENNAQYPFFAPGVGSVLVRVGAAGAVNSTGLTTALFI
ncbi:hypothetical protein [Streptomyces sp. MMG1121]|uniref:hypothetical protein n=1 Tax=Streptomyces sp. MMG1121 TaxID=1415544 RepID=UPI00131D4DEA|nr:hypothetical protein [Streptomyces sp. MMG1121]